mgnify:CR=1 FL=1
MIQRARLKTGDGAAAPGVAVALPLLHQHRNRAAQIPGLAGVRVWLRPGKAGPLFGEKVGAFGAQARLYQQTVLGIEERQRQPNQQPVGPAQRYGGIVAQKQLAPHGRSFEPESQGDEAGMLGQPAQGGKHLLAQWIPIGFGQGPGA